MPRIPDPNESRLDRIERIVSRVSKASPLERSSVSNGLLQFIGGTLQGLSGALFDWAGRVHLVGELIQTGPSKFDGSVEITETLDVTAETTLRSTTHVQGDLVIEEDGLLRAGVVVIDGTDGGRIAAPGNTLALIGQQITFTGATTARNGILSEGDIVALQDLVVAGRLEVATMPTLPSGVAARAVVVGADGKLYRAPAA